MKLAFIRLSYFFKRSVCTVQQIADNTSLTVEDILNLDNIEPEIENIEFINGSLVKDIVTAKLNGSGSIQYWKGVLSNV